MVVLVEDAVESILSSDGELVQFPRFDDRLGEWTTGSGALQSAMGSMIVVEGFEFAQGVHGVGLVQDEGAVERFGSPGADPALHDRVHPGYADRGRDRGDDYCSPNHFGGSPFCLT